MGPTYAGVLGFLSFCVAVARGVLYSSGPEAVMLGAGLSMFAFAAVGYVAGTIAERTIQQSVDAQVEAQQKAAGAN